MEAALYTQPGSSLLEALLGVVKQYVREELDTASREPRYVSKEKLAEIYGVKERTIKTWRAKGLPGVSVGREIMFNLDACDLWIEAHT
jgi:hypothetical protein